MTKTLHIQINTGTAAFAESPSDEIGRILARAAQTIRDHGLPPKPNGEMRVQPWQIHDSQGQYVGIMWTTSHKE